jgi:hypothetical protein
LDLDVEAEDAGHKVADDPSSSMGLTQKAFS